MPTEGEFQNVEAALEGAVAESISAASDPEDEAEVEVEATGIYAPFLGAAVASVEERIFLADVIVRANLVSAADGVLRFRAIEYLKGAGADEFSVQASTNGRDTQWDGIEAVLFLSTPASGAAADSSVATLSEFDFSDTTEFDYQPLNEVAATSYTGDLPKGYTVDSRNPVWLPLESGAGSGTGGEALGLHKCFGVRVGCHVSDHIPGRSPLKDSVGGWR